MLFIDLLAYLKNSDLCVNFVVGFPLHFFLIILPNVLSQPTIYTLQIKAHR